MVSMATSRGAPATAAPQSGRGTWRQVGSVLGGGGTVLALAATPAEVSPVELYAGTAAGVVRSDDAGATWAAVTYGLAAPYVQTIALSPAYARDRTIFAGALGSGVLRSTNAGHDWHPLEFWSGSPSVTAIVLSPNYAHDSTIIVGTQSEGVLRSTNGGRTW